LSIFFLSDFSVHWGINGRLGFLLSTYEIWKVLASLANFHVLSLFIYLKTSLERKKNFRLSRGVAGGFSSKFKAQLAQPGKALQS
jgi:hypothetical protein